MNEQTVRSFSLPRSPTMAVVGKKRRRENLLLPTEAERQALGAWEQKTSRLEPKVVLRKRPIPM